MTTFLSNRDIYISVVCGIVPQEREKCGSDSAWAVKV